MGQYHRLSLEQRRELARRHRRGERAEALAAAYGVSVHRIVAAQTAETARARDPTVSVSFRAPRSEVAAFKALAAETGLGRRGSAMRALVRMASGLLTVPPTHLEAAQHAAIALSRLGVNLNQLARRANMGRIAITEADRALLRALGREVPRAGDELRRARDEALDRQAHARAALARHGAVAGDGGDEGGGGVRHGSGGGRIYVKLELRSDAPLVARPRPVRIGPRTLPVADRSAPWRWGHSPAAALTRSWLGHEGAR